MSLCPHLYDRHRRRWSYQARQLFRSGSPAITATDFLLTWRSTYEWEKSSDNFGMNIMGTGQTNPSAFNPGSISTTTYYRLRVQCGTNMSTDYSNIITITINPSAAIISPANPVICAGQNLTLNETGGTGTSWIWSPGGQNDTPIMVSPTNNTVYSDSDQPRHVHGSSFSHSGRKSGSSQHGWLQQVITPFAPVNPLTCFRVRIHLL